MTLAEVESEIAYLVDGGMNIQIEVSVTGVMSAVDQMGWLRQFVSVADPMLARSSSSWSSTSGMAPVDPDSIASFEG